MTGIRGRQRGLASTAAPAVVLARTADFVVIDKPSGIATEPDREGSPSLLDAVRAWLRAEGEPQLEPHALSRLDTPVSGAVTFSVSRRGHALAPTLKAEGRLARRYVALARGNPTHDDPWTSPIDGKSARTEHRTVAIASGASLPVSLLSLAPITGRTHQLRIHASRAGHPLLGDRRYGGPTSLASASGAVRPIPRVLLHAVGVELVLRDERLTAISPIPPDFEAIWRSAGGEAESVEACLSGVTSSDRPHAR